jgi:PLP dependent protein
MDIVSLRRMARGVLMSSMAERISEVRERIAAAAARAGRDAAAITLLAVSKTQPPERIREACACGQRIFGENYAQELRDKAAALADLPIDWHFIGHLQKNKAKYVVPVAAMMESVDSAELADALDRRAASALPCLIEVNVGGEESKSGCAASDVLPLARHLLALPHLDLRGLMVIPPYDADPEKSRPYFQRLRTLLAEANRALTGVKVLTELSMGMSHDVEAAIEEGATIVRVGSAIFGER